MSDDISKLRIVVGYDFSALAQQALEMAAALCSGFAGVALHAVTVLDSSLTRRGLVAAVDYSSAAELQEKLRAVTERLPTLFDMMQADLYAHARIGDPTDEIVALADEIRADMIVVGTHGHKGLQRLLLGSVAETVTRYAHCPVLCVRPPEYHRIADQPAPGPEPPGPEMDHRLEPHVYRYEQDIAPMRPPEWPLY